MLPQFSPICILFNMSFDMYLYVCLTITNSWSIAGKTVSQSWDGALVTHTALPDTDVTNGHIEFLHLTMAGINILVLICEVSKVHLYLAGWSIAVCYRWWFERLLCARVLSRVVFTCDAVCVVCVCVQVQHAEDDLSDCFLVGSHHCQLAVMHTTKPRGTISYFTLPYHTLLWHIIV